MKGGLVAREMSHPASQVSVPVVVVAIALASLAATVLAAALAVAATLASTSLGTGRKVQRPDHLRTVHTLVRAVVHGLLHRLLLVRHTPVRPARSPRPLAVVVGPRSDSQHLRLRQGQEVLPRSRHVDVHDLGRRAAGPVLLHVAAVSAHHRRSAADDVLAEGALELAALGPPLQRHVVELHAHLEEDVADLIGLAEAPLRAQPHALVEQLRHRLRHDALLVELLQLLRAHLLGLGGHHPPRQVLLLVRLRERGSGAVEKLLSRHEGRHRDGQADVDRHPHLALPELDGLLAVLRHLAAPHPLQDLNATLGQRRVLVAVRAGDLLTVLRAVRVLHRQVVEQVVAAVDLLRLRHRHQVLVRVLPPLAPLALLLRLLRLLLARLLSRRHRLTLLRRRRRRLRRGRALLCRRRRRLLSSSSSRRLLGRRRRRLRLRGGGVGCGLLGGRRGRRGLLDGGGGGVHRSRLRLLDDGGRLRLRLRVRHLSLLYSCSMKYRYCS
eukprot:Rhum_TRINITY_DN14748_c1_g1::Rhum_TRINITY_DN14748_c1_g1_i1::g.114579::m.114579